VSSIQEEVPIVGAVDTLVKPRRNIWPIEFDNGTVTFSRLAAWRNIIDMSTIGYEPMALLNRFKPLVQMDLMRTCAEGIRDLYTPSLDMDQFLDISIEMLRKWANDTAIDIAKLIDSHYLGKPITPASVLALCMCCRIRLPYVLMHLHGGTEVDLPSAICGIITFKDNSETLHHTPIGPIHLGGVYKPVYFDGEVYDLTKTFSHPSTISFNPEEDMYGGVEYFHLTLTFHKELGTPVSHMRYAHPDSIVTLMGLHHIKLPEWLWAPYKYDPLKGHSILDMFVYPPSLIVDADWVPLVQHQVKHDYMSEFARVTDKLMWLWLHRPNDLLRMGAPERYHYAENFVGTSSTIFKGKYTVNPDVRAAISNLPAEDVAILDELFYL